MHYLEQTYTKKFLVIYLTFKFNFWHSNLTFKFSLAFYLETLIQVDFDQVFIQWTFNMSFV